MPAVPNKAQFAKQFKAFCYELRKAQSREDEIERAFNTFVEAGVPLADAYPMVAEKHPELFDEIRLEITPPEFFDELVAQHLRRWGKDTSDIESWCEEAGFVQAVEREYYALAQAYEDDREAFLRTCVAMGRFQEPEDGFVERFNDRFRRMQWARDREEEKEARRVLSMIGYSDEDVERFVGGKNA